MRNDMAVSCWLALVRSAFAARPCARAAEPARPPALTDDTIVKLSPDPAEAKRQRETIGRAIEARIGREGLTLADQLRGARELRERLWADPFVIALPSQRPLDRRLRQARAGRVAVSDGFAAGDALWIFYSIGKERIGVTRVPLSAVST